MLELLLNELKLVAKSRGIKGYKSISKERLLSILSIFARSNRVSQIPAILLKNKARQSKTKTRFSYDGHIIFAFS